MSSLHIKSFFCIIFVRQNKPPILMCWYVMRSFICFKLVTGRFLPSFFPTKNTLLKISSFKLLVLHMASFYNMLCISICTWCFRSKFMWGVSRFFCWTGILWKDILYPSISSKISESFISIFSVSRKCLIFVQVTIFELLFQKITFLSLDVCF